MTITSKNCLVSHVLSFANGELVGGYIEDFNIFVDDYGFVLGSSDICRTEILPEHLASMANLLDLVYSDKPEVEPEPDLFSPEVEQWATEIATEIFKELIAQDLPLVSEDPIVLPTAPEATPAVVAPVEASTDVTISPEVTPVVTEVQGVPEDAKPEPTPAATEPANESTDPTAPAIATSPDIVVDGSQEPVSSLPVVDAGTLSPVVEVPGSDVVVAPETAPIIETKSTDNLNDSDNELARQAFL